MTADEVLDFADVICKKSNLKLQITQLRNLI